MSDYSPIDQKLLNKDLESCRSEAIRLIDQKYFSKTEYDIDDWQILESLCNCFFSNQF